MRPTRVRDFILLNVFFGCLLVVLVAVCIWLGIGWGDLADRYKSIPALVPDAYYSQGMYDKLREVAVNCYKLQDEIHVSSLRLFAKQAFDGAWIFVVLAALFFTNAWAFRKFVRDNVDSRSNP